MKYFFFSFLTGIACSVSTMENEETFQKDNIMERIETLINDIPADQSENEFVQEIELEKKIHAEYLTLFKTIYNCAISEYLQKNPDSLNKLSEKISNIENNSNNKENDLQKLLFYMTALADRGFFHKKIFCWLKSYCAIQASKTFFTDHY